MDINSFAVLKIRYDLEKYAAADFVGIAFHRKFSDNFQPRRFKRAKQPFTSATPRPLSLLTRWPIRRQICLERGNLCEQEESVGQSERLCCLRTNATRGTDPWNWGHVGQGVNVMMSCLRFCRCERLFADVMYFTGGKVPTVCQQTFVPTSVAYQMCSTCSSPDQKPAIARPMKELKRQSSDWVKLWPVWITVMFRRKES